MPASQHALPTPHAIGKSPMSAEARPFSPSWSFGFFLEGLALYGAMPCPMGLFCFDDDSAGEQVSQPADARQNRGGEGSRSALFEVTDPDPKAGTVRKVPRAAPVELSLAVSERSAAVAFAPPDRNRRILSLAATFRWIFARWRCEREIRRAIDALAKFDDRTLRDIGIPDRSQIERVVRYCRDC